MTRLYAVLTMLLLVSPAALADEVPYRRYTVSDGLPNEDIHALAQTADGRLYVGTPGGLAVYNGQRFRRVILPDSIGATGLSTITVDGRRVWASTDRGWVIEIRAGRVMPVVHRFRGVQSLLVRNDTLHIIARRGYWALPPGAQTPNRQRLRLTFQLPGRRMRADVGGGLSDADFGPRGDLWVLDSHLGPGRVQPDGSVRFAEVPHGSGPKGWWNEMQFGPGGTALLYGRRTVYRFDPATDRLTALLERGGDFYFDRGIAYVSSRTGVARLRWDGGGDGRELRSLDEMIGLPNLKARCVLRDHEGALWLGTRGGLLHLFAPNVRHISRIDGTSLVYADRFSRDAQGGLWVNTWGSGLIRLRPRRARFTPGGATRWSTVDSRDQQLHAKSRHGWFRWTPAGHWQHVAPQNGAVRGVVNSEGVGYFFHNRGLYRHDPDTEGPPERLYAWEARENGRHTHTLAPDGDIILRAKGHLLRGTPSDGRGPVRFDTIAALPSYADDAARYMAYDASGTAWLAFQSRGLVRVETTGDSAHVDAILPGRSMKGVSLSGDSLIFAGAQDGLYVLDQRNGTVRRHLTAGDGLLATTTQNATIFVDTLYASHPRGVTAMPVSSVFRTPAPPAALLTRVERGYNTSSPRVSSTFDKGDRTVGFGFAATAFKNPQRVVYEYRLRPRDTTWASTRDGFTRYVDLGPGTYRFDVRARRARGPVGRATTYRFTIPRYFYETLWFQGLCLLLLLLGGVGAYRWRVRALRRRQRALEETVASRTEELREEKRKTEEQAERLVELDEAKNRFFANLSHEFRTPLMLIREPLSDLLDDTVPDLSAPVREKLRLMERNVRRLQHLIEQLLDLTRLEAGRMDLHLETHNLVAFTREQVQAFTPMAEREAVTLRFRSEPERVPADVDPAKMEQVLGNLLSNALTYTPEGGKVWVTVSARDIDDPPVAEIVVKDTGPGLTEDELRRIFDRFEQGRKADRSDGDGLGLGLALANELVELHEGTLRAESEPGFGTAFIVQLPAHEPGTVPAGEGDDARDVAESEERPQPELLRSVREAEEDPHRSPITDVSTEGQDEPDGASTEGPTVLLVEDSDDMRAHLRRHLTSKYMLIEAGDGREGLERAREHEPDLIVSDVMMPEMNGTALCEAVKADDALKTIPVVLLTARATSADAIEGLEHGADAYLTKPLDVGELCARIDRLLATRRELRERFSETVQVEPTGATTSSADVSFLEDVMTVVEEHLGDPEFGAGTLAEEMALSQRQLTRRLKEATDETPAALIRRLRLERAAQLLEDDTRTVAETAYAVGYRSPSHFSTAFRKQFGCPPSEYDGT